MSLEVGQHAPSFVLPGTSPDPVSLDSLRGKSVLLLFFPFAFTHVCHKEFCDLRDGIHLYTSLNAQILGVSIDSPFTLKAWSAQEGFPFPLLSDFNKTVSRDYDVLYEDLNGLHGVSKRAAFVIDKDGVIRYSEICPTTQDLPDFDAIRLALESIGQ